MVPVSSTHVAAVAFDRVDDRIGGCSLREAILGLVNAARADWSTVGIFGFNARPHYWRMSNINTDIVMILVLVRPRTIETSQAAELVQQIYAFWTSKLLIISHPLVKFPFFLANRAVYLSSLDPAEKIAVEVNECSLIPTTDFEQLPASPVREDNYKTNPSMGASIGPAELTCSSSITGLPASAVFPRTLISLRPP